MIKQYDNFRSITKGEIRRAGKILKEYYSSLNNNNVDNLELQNAQILVQEWRGHFIYPLNTLQKFFRDNLKALGYEKTALIGQRLKRLNTIGNKLSRIDGTLESMQDIGGMRIILENVEQVNIFQKRLEKSKTKHKFKIRDYVTNPKPDGYRSIHYIYECNSSSPKAPREILGMKIELQLRTLLQHYWATAVESVDMFYGQSLKTGGESDAVWKEFFLLVSCAFAIMECNPLPKQYEILTRNEIKQKIVDINNRHNLDEKLNAIRLASKLGLEDDMKDKNYNYLSLMFVKENNKSLRLRGLSFMKSSKSFEELMEIHNQDERAYNPDKMDMVLIETSKKHLRTIYSNYFLEISDFLNKLKEFMNE